MAFWVVKATMTTVALYVSVTTIIVEPEGAELIKLAYLGTYGKFFSGPLGRKNYYDYCSTVC